MKNSKKGRFIVYDVGSDPYKFQQVMQENWDRLDSAVGGPDGSPGTTSTTTPNGVASSWLTLGTASANDPQNRTLYSVISGLVGNDVPLGSVIQWWRPSIATTIPDGWVPCDGSTYTNNTASTPPIILHSYGTTSLTVPDLRNAFILGAHETTTATYTAAPVFTPLNRDGTAAASGNLATNGPGINGAGGSNAVFNLDHQHLAGSNLLIPDHTHNISHTHSFSHTHTIPAHTHTVPAHNHSMSHTHAVANHTHTIDNHVHDMQHNHNFNHTFTVHVVGGTERETNLGTKGGTPRVSHSGAADAYDHNHAISINVLQNIIGSTSSAIYDSSSGFQGLARIKTGVGEGFPGVPVSGAAAPGTDTGSASVTGDSAVLTTGGTANGTDTPSNSITGPASATNSGTVNSALTITGETAGVLGSTLSAKDLRPRYVGLLYLIKIKTATNLI
jgi:hypothetical protein